MKPLPWSTISAIALPSVAILGMAVIAVAEHRRANDADLRFQQEKRSRQILARCHYWSLEGYAIADPNDCLTFDPVKWKRTGETR